MSRKVALVLLFLLAVAPPLRAGNPVSDQSVMDVESFEESILKAIAEPTVPFEFLVHCRNDKGSRSARVFSGGVAIWESRLQLNFSRSLRQASLEDLLTSGFAAFQPRYGGKSEAGDRKGPLRVSCRVQVEVDGLAKESVQLADGAQFQALATLASSLLDRLEPLAANGIGAASLEDGLRKIAAGVLSPEMLAVRLVRLPPKGSDADGDIMRVDAARWSCRNYQPGEVGPGTGWRPLPADFAADFAGSAIASEFWSLPVNVPGTWHREFEIRVLGHRKTVISSDFARIEPGTMRAETERFDRVVAAMLELRR